MRFLYDRQIPVLFWEFDNFEKQTKITLKTNQIVKRRGIHREIEEDGEREKSLKGSSMKEIANS